MNIAYTTLDSTRSTGPATSSGSTARGGLGAWFGRVGRSAWRAVEASNQARAQRQLAEFADRCEALQPELAKELRAASRDMRAI